MSGLCKRATATAAEPIVLTANALERLAEVRAEHAKCLNLDLTDAVAGRIEMFVQILVGLRALIIRPKPGDQILFLTLYGHPVDRNAGR